MENIDDLVEQEFEEQLAQGLVPAPLPRSVRITFKVEGHAVERTRTVPEPEVERTIERLLARGAFDINV